LKLSDFGLCKHAEFWKKFGFGRVQTY
jgi:hypothetical protein